MIKRNSILYADNLEILKQLPDRCINLVYIDPPFGTGSVQKIASTAFVNVDGYEDKLTGVADFYCGSGTTGVAAKNLGRDYLLVDNNQSAIQVSSRRLGK